MALSIREADAKRLLGESLSERCVSVNTKTDLEQLPRTHPWLMETSLVVKPDVLLKRRGKSGLVKLNISFEQAKEFLKAKLNTELTVEGLTGVFDHFIIEPFFPHDDKTNEMYIAIRTLREGDQILFSHRGGVDVGDVDSHALRVTIPVFQTASPDKSTTLPLLEPLFANVTDPDTKAHLPDFVFRLYSQFCSMQFAFLELNPISYDAKNKTFVVLDAAAKVDHTADIICPALADVEYPSPFGRALTAEEQYIRDLDSKTGASLKLTVLNPKGRIWTMIAGGGASVVYADTICDFGMANELCNYGEYSGAPSEVTTYEYAKTILSLMTAPGTYREEGKILLIGGGIANFTSVADTFRGIIRALRGYATQLKQFKVRIYVRRGGPNYQDGLKMMRDIGKELDLFVKVYGPETYVTAIIPLALADDNGENSVELRRRATQGITSDNGKHAVMAADTWQSSVVDNTTQSEEQVPVVVPQKQQQQIITPTGGVSQQQPLFTADTRCFVWGLQERAVQEMLDFDHVCGRKKASVAAIIYEFAVSHLRPFYFGSEEIFLPVCQTLNEAVQKFPTVDTIVNFASMRSAAQVTQLILDSAPQIKSIAVIAEGVPERRTRQLNELAASKNVTIIGPATVGGIKPGCFRVGNTGGRLENIMNSKLYRPGSVAFVTKSGGMLNELNNVLSLVSDGCYEGVAIGGDRFPATTMMDHVMRYEADPKVKMIVILGEVGGQIEYEVAQAIVDKRITKPVVAWCVGTCAPMFSTEVSFGHAGAWAGSESEHATAKNAALQKAGATVPDSFQDLGHAIGMVFQKLVDQGVIQLNTGQEETPRVPMDYQWAKKLGLVRKPKSFVSTISDDRGEELVYAGFPISKVLQSTMGVGGVVSLLWFKRPLPDYCYRYLEMVLMLTADHGPAVSGAMNCIVTARAGKDLISSLISGLCTIGDRFGGACDQAAAQFWSAKDKGWTPEDFVREMKNGNKLIMGIGHKIKSVHNPDMRVQLLKKFCKANFRRQELISYAEEVEQVTTRKKDTLILNVDGLMGVSMIDMLMGCGAFSEEEARDFVANGCINGLFVLGRSIGFIGHYLDQKRLKQGLYRHDADDIAYVLPELPKGHH